MQGPTAAMIFARRAPSPSMAATVASKIPSSAPRQPACAAATTPASGSAKRTGAQSAVSALTAMPRSAVTMPSALGRAPFGQALVGDDRQPAVHLVGTEELAGTQMCAHARAVFQDGCRIIPRPRTAIEGGVKTQRYPAEPRKEAVRYARQRRKVWSDQGLQHGVGSKRKAPAREAEASARSAP